MSKTRYRLNWGDIQRFQQDQISETMRYVGELGRVAELSLMGVRLTLLSDPELIQELLIKHANKLERDGFTRRIFRRILGESVFVEEGAAWRKKRLLIQPIFQPKNISRFADDFYAQTSTLVETWRPGQTIHLEKEMMDLALKIICKTMFGADVAGVLPRISELMDKIMTEAEVQLRPPVLDWFPTIGFFQQKRAIKELRQILLTIIKERKGRLAQKKVGEPDLLTMLLHAIDEEGNALSETDVLEECLTVFVAGHETTAVALTWLWSVVLNQPDIYARLKAEIDSVFGKDEISYERLSDAPYLSQVIKESLRLYSPAHGFGRTPIEDFSAGGYDFKKGDTLIFSIYALHRLEEIYPHPNRFDPDRWDPSNPQPSRYVYMPFGAGARTCIGNAFAFLEMQIAVATIIQQVELSLLPGQEFDHSLKMTFRPRTGVKAQVETRRNQEAQLIQSGEPASV